MSLEEELIKAVKKNDYGGVITAIDRGACLDCRDENGNTLLHIAAETTGYEVCDYFDLLVKANINVNAKNNRGDTPLDVFIDNLENYIYDYLGSSELDNLIKSVEDLISLLQAGAKLGKFIEEEGVNKH